MPKKSLQNKISKKLDQLQELLDNIEEVRAINSDDPETWDSDTLYNLAENSKEMLELLENKEVGLLALISDWETEKELEEE